jgi:hypothetical protein
MHATPFATTTADAAPGHAPRPHPLADEAQGRLDWLRQVAARSRGMPGEDMFRACAMLGTRGHAVAAEHAATALFRVLPRVLGRTRLRLYEGGALERSFDEDWLLAALDAAGRGDEDSLTFLMARRLPHHARRQAACLVAILARALDKLA